MVVVKEAELFSKGGSHSSCLHGSTCIRMPKVALAVRTYTSVLGFGEFDDLVLRVEVQKLIKSIGNNLSTTFFQMRNRGKPDAC